MSDEQVRTTVAEILAEVADLDPTEVRMDSAFGTDLDVDSLLMVEILVAIEERFGIRIPEENARDVKTVADLVAQVQALRVPA